MVSSVWKLQKQRDIQTLLERPLKDLGHQKAVKVYQAEKPGNYWWKVGELANDTYPLVLMDNMLSQNNLIRSFMKTMCISLFSQDLAVYPKFLSAFKEEYLLTNSLEPTNEWYAVAKISGVKLIEALRKEYGRDYVSLMPTNLYGPNDNFDLKSSHVLPAMIRKFHEAKLNGNATVELWGTGSPMREFLHVDDLAQAVLFGLENTLKDHLYNVGTGVDLTIKDLALLIQSIVGHKGELEWDINMPDGTPRKLMDIGKLHSQGWNATIELVEGVSKTYAWFLDNLSDLKFL